MNIFVLDYNIRKAAQYHNDKHSVKMVLETCQLLDTARFLNGVEPIHCKPTHLKHPCSSWAAESYENYLWLSLLGIALSNEYTLRYDKVHKLDSVIRQQHESMNEIKFKQQKRTPFKLCMPDQYKTNDAVESYRNYYINEKAHFSKWRNGNIPEWFKEKVLV